jgi:hypothetical protein
MPRLNPFVVDRSKDAGVALPDIEVPLREQYGQLSEDIIVDGLLTAWAERTGSDLSRGRYLEIGAHHPSGQAPATFCTGCTG